tara:strand:- start:536 stop:787 length:252 start_codon:yes stop_codon:yes gene_type:complete
MENSDLTVETKLRRAFGNALMKFEIPAILTVDDVISSPDPKNIIAYVAYFKELEVLCDISLSIYISNLSNPSIHSTFIFVLNE